MLKIILVLGKREVSLTVPLMENLFAMMEPSVNPKKHASNNKEI